MFIALPYVRGRSVATLFPTPTGFEPVWGKLLHEQVALLEIAKATGLFEAAAQIEDYLGGILDGYEDFGTVEELVAAVKKAPDR